MELCNQTLKFLREYIQLLGELLELVTSQFIAFLLKL
jgi:hypothetical protein